MRAIPIPPAWRVPTSPLLRRQVSDLDIDQRTRVPRERPVLALVRATKPRPRRIFAMLIEERTFDDKNLFTAPVRVFVELGMRCPFHECNLFSFVLMQAHDLEAWNQAR